jgi:D-alanine-D-alanine ligase
MPVQKLRVAVLRGGNPPSFSNSLDSGKVVLSSLQADEDAYEPIDIFVSKDGVWHYRGLPVEPHVALKHVDMAFNTIPDDISTLQTLESMHVPHVGSEIVPSAILGNIEHLRRAYEQAGIRTRKFEALDSDNLKDEDLVRIFRSFVMPAMVRAHEKNSNFKSKVVSSYLDLEAAVKEAFNHTKKVVIEEYMKGKVAVCSVIEDARGEELHALLPAEMKGERYNSPGSFSIEEKRAIEDLARSAHKALGLKRFSTSQFLITPKGKIHILETTTFPEMRENSSLRTSLRATGWKDKEFVEHLLNQARDI